MPSDAFELAASEGGRDWRASEGCAVLDQPDRAGHADCLLALNQLFNPAVGLALFALAIFAAKTRFN